MSEWAVKKGNTAILDVEIKDKEGDLVTDLADVTEAKFHVKESKSSTEKKIEVVLGDGVDMNVPSVGYVRITLRPSHTSIDVEKYFMGLQLKWSADEVSEVDIKIDGVETDVFRVRQETVL